MKCIIVFLTLISAIQIQALAQKGVIAKYNTDKLYICFMHIETGKMFKDPVVIGRNVTIQHNISYEKIALTYTGEKDRQPHHVILSFVRYEQDGNKGIIMEDGDGNPATVYNELNSNGGLSVIRHGIDKDGYVTMFMLEDAIKE